MKTAIFVRGHARTWGLTKEHTLKFFTQLYGDCDWYMSVVKTATLSLQQIYADFQNYRLIYASTLDASDYTLEISHDTTVRWSGFSSAYWRLAWLDYDIGKAKRVHERSNGIYDNVVFIRPDVWYYTENDAARARVTQPLKQLSVVEMGTSGDTDDDFSSGDLIYRTGSIASDVMSLRYIDPWYTDNMKQLIHGNSHALLAAFGHRRFLGYDQDYKWGIESFIIRPDHVDRTRWHQADIDPDFRDSRTWADRNPREKIAYCRQLSIDPEDYQLPNDIDH